MPPGNAIAATEHTAKMGLVCATPTRRSAGAPAFSYLLFNNEQQLDFVAGAACH